MIFQADNITYYKCDVSRWEEVEAVSQRVIEEVHIRLGPRSPIRPNVSLTQVGEPTILVNNAGVVQGKLILDLTPSDINQ